MKRFLILLVFATLGWALVYGVVAHGQASVAPTYDLYADDDRYALSVTCHGGQLRLWQDADTQGGILFCEPAETPVPTIPTIPAYTAEPLIGGGGQQQRTYFPYLSAGE